MEIPGPDVVAFIDLGTNSARLLVVRLNPNRSYTIITQQKEVVRLGEGEFEENLLIPEAIERTVVVLSRLAEIARNFQAEEIVAVATSATRDARNRNELIDRLYYEAGVDIHVISGPEEARLIWLGISSGIEIGTEKCLFIDIGGGSTEIIVADKHQPSLLRSLKLGAIRTTNAFLTGETGPIPAHTLQKMRRDIASRLSHTIRNVRNLRVFRTYGSSGTIQTLEAVAAQMKLSVPHQAGVITLSELSSVISLLCSLPLKDRRTLPGLNPDRADIIIAGGLILEGIMQKSGISEITVSNRSLRDGLLVDYLSRIPGFPHAEPIPVRLTSVRQLGRSCLVDEPHAIHVAALSLSLFDSARELGLHTLDDSARDLLSHAAYLHDIGQFISFSGHHQHSFYVITHAPLLGFNEYEILMMGLVTRYHRKKIPRIRDQFFSDLDPEDRVAVQYLAQFLRIAENLDRSHDGRIASASFTDADSESVTLVINCRSDCTLERWALEGDAKGFEKTFSKSLKPIVGSAPLISGRNQ
ncbi:MAG TPA: Ppx/GppA phosphatase family protein [Methanospirillum sp.]|nr:Ppx/GppA phosphatase family protein [Methanospirillum sp.]